MPLMTQFMDIVNKSNTKEGNEFMTENEMAVTQESEAIDEPIVEVNLEGVPPEVAAMTNEQAVTALEHAMLKKEVNDAHEEEKKLREIFNATFTKINIGGTSQDEVKKNLIQTVTDLIRKSNARGITFTDTDRAELIDILNYVGLSVINFYNCHRSFLDMTGRFLIQPTYALVEKYHKQYAAVLKIIPMSSTQTQLTVEVQSEASMVIFVAQYNDDRTVADFFWTIHKEQQVVPA